MNSKIKKGIKTVLLAILVLLIVMVAVCGSRIHTVTNMKNVCGDLYYVDYYNDYKLDKVMDTDIASVAEMAGFISKNILFGYPIDLSEDTYGCTSFIARNEEGDVIFARNFDYSKSPSVIVHCNPKNGYESYSMMPTFFLDLTTKEEVESLYGHATCLALPYSPVDGFNEAGLAVSVLELKGEMTAQDDGHINVMTTEAVRILLDTCATVDEAIELLSNRDMYSAVGAPYHIFVADKEGNSVIFEWPENQFCVQEERYVTNFRLIDGPDHGYNFGTGQGRYEIVGAKLAETDSVLSSAEAMQLLCDARNIWGAEGEFQTEYSVVYNLTDFTFEVANDMDYDNIYSFPR